MYGNVQAQATVKAERSPWLLFTFLSAVFFFSQHELSYAGKGIGNYNLSTIDVATAVAKGSLTHYIVLISLAIMAIISLATYRTEPRPRLDLPFGWTLVGFVLWASLSPIWAEDFALTFKRTVIFWILCVAACAFARRLSLREIIVWTMFSTSLYLIIGISAEVYFGTFHPFSSGYRFAGSLHPNGAGIECGLLSLSAVAAASLNFRRRRLYWACACLGLVFVVLSGSRTALGACLLALGAYFVAVSSRKRKIVVAVIVCVMFVLAASILGSGLIPNAKDTITLGRTDDAGDDNTFNGRTKVWQDVSYYARQRPIAGYGYAGFWTPNHIRVISDEEQWGVAASHSAYLDCLLALGAVGLLAYVVLLCSGIKRAFRFHRLSQDPGFAFCGAVLVYFAADGLLDSINLGESLLVFLCMVVLARFATVWRPEQATSPHGLVQFLGRE
jgi:O-antigen ligase